MDQWQLWQERLMVCERCQLSQTRTQVVIGSGNRTSAIMLLGEAPGREEDIAGQPFCGAAGKKLNVFLAQLGLKREDIYLGNIVKCRPIKQSARGLANRPPTKKELSACRVWLECELNLLKPQLIVTLGATPLSAFTSSWPSMQEWHGQPFVVDKPAVKVFPLYHPAALMYNRRLEDDYCRDVEKLRLLLVKDGMIE